MSVLPYIALYQSGKSISCLVKEYNVTRAVTYKWIKQFTNSGSFIKLKIIFLI
ncbi:helix-turn-helix domain-containing protein [Spiroplasma ixodetis]|uniref:helix-turn-helix domain-containing protein n=1 Tax=Spiroplasma ixodetis TaxID=2141 RepID=UPI002575DEBA|nr:helix-turn-helix domain-containing protein [Spiroplasma ixodetis]